MLHPYSSLSDYELLEKKMVALMTASWPISKRLWTFSKSHKADWIRKRQMEGLELSESWMENNYKKIWGNF
jgi:hypothetical protein